MSGFRTNRLKPDLRPHQRKVGYFSREWSSEIDSFIAAARTFAGPSSGSTIGGNGVTTEISDEPPAQPSNCTAEWCSARPSLKNEQPLPAKLDPLGYYLR
jgi:hypothetical protein